MDAILILLHLKSNLLLIYDFLIIILEFQNYYIPRLIKHLIILPLHKLILPIFFSQYLLVHFLSLDMQYHTSDQD